MFERWNQYTYPQKSSLTSEALNRVLAISCLPGGGKTYFLDALSLYRQRMNPLDNLIEIWLKQKKLNNF